MAGFGDAAFGDDGFGGNADFPSVNLAVRQLVRQALAMDKGSIRPANEGTPKTAKGVLFATVLITSQDANGWDAIQYSNIADDTEHVAEEVSGMRHYQASVQFFGTGASSQANRLPMMLQTSASVQFMLTTGVLLAKVGTVPNMTHLLGSAWEDRAQITLDFYAAVAAQAPVSTIDTASPIVKRQ